MKDTPIDDDPDVAWVMRIQSRLGRVIEGEESEHIKTMLGLLDPIRVWSNQRSVTMSYTLGELEYQWSVGDGIDLLVERTNNDLQ